MTKVWLSDSQLRFLQSGLICYMKNFDLPKKERKIANEVWAKLFVKGEIK